MEKWSDVRGSINSLTQDERTELDLSVKIISKIIARRNELKITQRKLSAMSGIKQSAIARLEKLDVIPRIDTLYKLLSPLGLNIEIVQDKSKAIY